ncbi:hypothetical protein [Photobacterium minamisatsumaniensis]|uniref:hypothetical protein n=1 Tax=Photobacterium minamisatsumaniensis TaxID=2910233 RepID=UPI003D107CA0
MEELLTKNASAVFAILGVLLGAIVTGLFGYYGKSRETKLKLAEKFVDKKLEAHDQIINLANSMRTMVVVEGEHEGNELPRYPALFSNRQQFDDFLSYLNQVQTQSERWLSAELKRELCFFIDYIVTLRKWTEQVNDIGLPRLGVALRNDFIDISGRIEDAAHDFINNDVVKINFKTDRRWHKFKPEETERMFSRTVLVRRKPELQLIVDGEIT